MLKSKVQELRSRVAPSHASIPPPYVAVFKENVHKERVAIEDVTYKPPPYTAELEVIVHEVMLAVAVFM